MKILIATLIPFLFIGGFIIATSAVDECKSSVKSRVLVGLILPVLACFAYFISINLWSYKKIKSSKFDLTTEVRQELLNGQEISRDTVYIFTPKKKEK